MNEEDIPIDIHYNKLLDWFLNRRHASKNWQALTLVVRQKINDAIQDMPEHPDITCLLAGTYINYFHCLKIIEILKETEAASKNIFGRYSSQRMKDWKEIISLYEKDGNYLAEAAQLIIRNVNYEIPALKKQKARCQQMQRDCQKKESEYLSNSSQLQHKYKEQCKKMGIEGKKIKRELMELVKNLPEIYSSIAEETKEFQAAVEYYDAFTDFMQKPGVSDNHIQLLKYVMLKGNTTTYQWKYGEPPEKIDENTMNYSFEDEEIAETEEIDFNVDSGAIDFGDGGAIDFGDSGEIDFGEEAEEIDFGDNGNIEIEVVEVSDKPEVQEVESSEGANSNAGVAMGNDALTLLDNAETRNCFLNDLFELQCFLKQRLVELKTESDNIVVANIFQNAPDAILLEAPQVRVMYEKVTKVVNQITSSKMKDLMLIRGSPRHVEKIEAKLHHIIEESNKMLSMSRLMVTRSQEAVDEEQTVIPKLELVRRKMKELQKDVEKEISRKYKNRRVNIMGDINTV